MRLITLATWGGRITEPLYSFVEKHSDSDIFCFQELLKGGKGKTPRGDVKDSYESISNVLANHKGYFIEYGKNGYFGENIENPDFQYGISCFVSKKLKSEFVKSFRLCDPDKKWNDYTGLIAVGSSLSIKVEDYTIINIHGLWQESIKTDTEAKIEQSQKIIDLAENVSGKKIICGDFNLLPDTKSIEMLNEKYRNLIKEYNITNTRSSLYKKENRFADYIFTSPEIKINDFRVLENEVSDHLPLFLDFE